MRRSIVVLLISLGLLAAGGVGVAAAPGDRVVVPRAAWILAKGAGAEVKVRMRCQPADEPVGLSVSIEQGDDDKPRARGRLDDVPCTGETETYLVAVPSVANDARALLEVGEASVSAGLTNCFEREDCFDIGSGASIELARGDYVRPYDDDQSAELTYVRSLLTDDGRLRVAYDLTCVSNQLFPLFFTTRVSQANARDKLVVGQKFYPNNGDMVQCGPEPSRFRYVVPPAEGTSFRPGVAFVDTEFGDWYEWGFNAADRRPRQLAR